MRISTYFLRLFVCLIVLCASVPGAAARAATIPGYLQPITETASPFVGVTHYQIVQSLDNPVPYILPRELVIHIVEIDPQAPGVAFLGTPGNGKEEHEYTRQTTSQFVSDNDLAVAINGDFYTTNTGIHANVNGLGMSNGVVVSPPGVGDNRDNSLVTTSGNVASIISDPVIPRRAYNAVSGNQLLLRDGVNVTPGGGYTTALNPHTAAGVDTDNGHVFFMVVDGRQTDFSEGMRTDAMADILRDFGVDDAINLDGGGSSTLVFADGAGGAARTVNSPSDFASSQSPGNERSVANHFGVFATPNPDYVPLAAPPRPPAPEPDPLLTELTILDDFEDGEGHFATEPTFSGTTNGITTASSAEQMIGEAHQGDGSQQLTLVRSGAAMARVRHVSGLGEPTNNRVEVDQAQAAMGPQGFVGFFLKTTQADLEVYLAVDDGLIGSTGLERSNAVPVIADGEWHLYEWNLENASLWSNFSGGNGQINGPNVYFDSIVFETGASTANETLVVHLDTVAYNPHGSLAALAIPEPCSWHLWLPVMVALLLADMSRCDGWLGTPTAISRLD